jgi:3-(3-hydroxy-phenyl)propionate hydroxylase
VNSGRLSMPCNYVGHSLTGEDAVAGGPARSQPGMPCPDAPSPQEIEGIEIAHLEMRTSSDTNKTLGERFLGTAERAIYLIRPDQHIVARWSEYDAASVQMAVATALGKTQ